LHGKEEPVHKSQLVEWRRDDILVTFASQKMTLTVTTPDHQVHCTMLNSVLELPLPSDRLLQIWLPSPEGSAV
jgi:hypothetical protein